MSSDDKPRPEGETSAQPAAEESGGARAASGASTPAADSSAEAGEQGFFAAGDAASAAAAAPDADEVDPELLKLPRKRRRRRHPLISVAVIALSGYLMWFVRQDLLYFFQPRTPVDVGDAATALAQGKLKPGMHITLSGSPDRKHAIVLEARLRSGYESFFRLLGARNRVFVQQHRETRAAEAPITSSLSGELVRFDSLPYRKTLHAYFARAHTVAHDLDFAALERARASGAPRPRVIDRAGSEALLAASSTVWINVVYPNEWLIQLSKQAHPTAADAQRALADLKLPVAVDEEQSTAFHRFVVHARPAEVPALEARYRGTLQSGNIVRRQVSYTARWDQLSVERRGDERTLAINAADPTAPASYRVDPGDPKRLEAAREVPTRIPSRAVLFITVSSPLEIPPDALVLLAGRAPSEGWYYLALYVLLAAFIVINCWTLARRLRERSAPPQGANA
jgi:hypothetical protein